MAASAASPQVHLKREATTGFAAWDRVMNLPLPRLPGSPPAPRHCYFLDFEDAGHVIWNEPTVKTATAAGSGSAPGQQPADTLPHAGAQEEYELAAFLSVRNQLTAWLDAASNPPPPDNTPRPRKFLRIRRTGAADSNDNGVPDWLERRYGYPVFINSLADGLDSDGDGMSDKNEVLSGRDPRVADAPDPLVIAGSHDITFHRCQRTGETTVSAFETAATTSPFAFSSSPSFPSSWATYGKKWTTDPGWNPGQIKGGLDNVWTGALASAPGAPGVTITGGTDHHFSKKPFGSLGKAEGYVLRAFTEGRYSTTPFTSLRASEGYPASQSFNWILDGVGQEWEARLHTVVPGAAYSPALVASFPLSPQTLTRRFVRLSRGQPTGWPITAAENKGTWHYAPAPVCDTSTTLVLGQGEVTSKASPGVAAAAMSRLLLPDLTNAVEDEKQKRSERILAEISLLADTSRDGVLSPRDHYALQPAVYTVNYGRLENRMGGGQPVEDAIHWKGGDGAPQANGFTPRVVTAQYEDWRLPVQLPAAALPKTLSLLHIPSFPFGHLNLKVFLRLPRGSEKKVKAFHLYIARTNNGTTATATGLEPKQKEWVPVWGGCTAPPAGQADLPGGEIPANIRNP